MFIKNHGLILDRFSIVAMADTMTVNEDSKHSTGSDYIRVMI